MKLTQMIIAALAVECVIVIIAAAAGWLLQPWVILYWVTLLGKNMRDWRRSVK